MPDQLAKSIAEVMVLGQGSARPGDAELQRAPDREMGDRDTVHDLCSRDLADEVRLNRLVFQYPDHILNGVPDDRPFDVSRHIRFALSGVPVGSRDWLSW